MREGFSCWLEAVRLLPGGQGSDHTINADVRLHHRLAPAWPPLVPRRPTLVSTRPKWAETGIEKSVASSAAASRDRIVATHS